METKDIEQLFEGAVSATRTVNGARAAAIRLLDEVSPLEGEAGELIKPALMLQNLRCVQMELAVAIEAIQNTAWPSAAHYQARADEFRKRKSNVVGIR
jgi:hypothetical protein